jgi:hypothetical protein
MKSLFALLFSLALVLSQTASTDGSSQFSAHNSATPTCCGHCDPCQQRPCCASRDGSNSQPSTPTAPSRENSRNDWQAATALTVTLLPETASQPIAFPSSFSLSPTSAAPLYQRNCSYLI